MEKNLNHYMRSLHRDIGFFLIGFTIISCISGIVLIYRDTNFLKYDTVIEETFEPNLDEAELGKMLNIKDFKIQKVEGDSLYFQKGTYNITTGVARFTVKELPSFFSKINGLHKSKSKNITHWFTLTIGIMLLFLAISSLWMFKPKTELFRRGIYLTGAGVVVTIIILIII
ncbi:MAG: hypothetical protein EHM93_00610 [Bacteroidales bacterium]|nr:MAG: hypothetical protein EHM93_00610 [Bacteroidales bacterium]